MLIITALRRRLGQEDQTWFKASVGCMHIESLFEKQVGGGKMAHQVKAFATNLDELSLSPMTHTVEGEN